MLPMADSLEPEEDALRELTRTVAGVTRAIESRSKSKRRLADGRGGLLAVKRSDKLVCAPAATQGPCGLVPIAGVEPFASGSRRARRTR